MKTAQQLVDKFKVNLGYDGKLPFCDYLRKKGWESLAELIEKNPIIYNNEEFVKNYPRKKIKK